LLKILSDTEAEGEMLKEELEVKISYNCPFKMPDNLQVVCVLVLDPVAAECKRGALRGGAAGDGGQMDLHAGGGGG
jgi:hypothetical protein